MALRLVLLVASTLVVSTHSLRWFRSAVCRNTPSLNNGNIIRNGWNNFDYKCNTGYELSVIGNCRSRLWRPQVICKAVQCLAGVVIPNSDDTQSKGTFGDTVKATCNIGFTLNGLEGKRTCGPDGMWQINTACEAQVCPAGVIIPNSDDTSSTATFSETVMPTCNIGFTLNGLEGERICGADGMWQINTACEICPPGVIISNSDDTPSTGTFDSTVMSTCNNGFTASGLQGERICGPDGIWQINTDCEAQVCPAGVIIPNSDDTSSTATFSETVMPTCNIGFTLNGLEGERICGADGMWQINTACEICPPGVFISNSDDTPSTGTFDSTVLPTCNNGFTASGLQGERICGPDGIWQINTDCEAQVCPAGVIIPNSDDTSSTATFSETVMPTCNIGFTLNGLEGERICGADGMWQINTACEICPPGVFISNSDDTPSTGTFDSTVLPTCNNGFTASGLQGERICGPDGIWQINTDCEVCPPGVFISNSDDTPSTGTFDSIVMPTCNNGFTLFGLQGERICGPDGMWQINTECEAQVCPAGVIIPNSDDTSSTATFSETVMPTCNIGFTLNGLEGERICGADGMWQINTACEAVQCPAGVIIPNSDDTQSAATFDQTVKATCNNGFILNGLEGERTCGSDGMWQIIIPCEDI
ncbi:hypothetical protein LOTGIDRAFT_170189 [Lottia gigantea]|uniref:Sushi domain-containing protein n=1 Tax=Lottia gigantea TaxID=225164 RepID=V3ZN57_LOTGI|nr:hypothetical protein LOTGIDRAFT_170189 [Lottia gigantea]ESO82271.1 hypothetical protein LOTGIDRAFT_170189 [Lottia gigantea]